MRHGREQLARVLGGRGFQHLLGGALLLALTDRKMGSLQEPLIGVLFVLAATGGLLLLAQDPHGGDALKDMLAGQILWVDQQQLLWSAALLVPCGLLWLTLGARLGNVGFYAVFGFVACVALVLAAKHVLRPIIMRGEDYYDQ